MRVRIGFMFFVSLFTAAVAFAEVNLVIPQDIADLSKIEVYSARQSNNKIEVESVLIDKKELDFSSLTISGAYQYFWSRNKTICTFSNSKQDIKAKKCARQSSDKIFVKTILTSFFEQGSAEIKAQKVLHLPSSGDFSQQIAGFNVSSRSVLINKVYRDTTRKSEYEVKSIDDIEGISMNDIIIRAWLVN